MKLPELLEQLSPGEQKEISETQTALDTGSQKSHPLKHIKVNI